jgi:hypothetical protein
MGFVWCFLYGRGGCLIAKNDGFRPGQLTSFADATPAAAIPLLAKHLSEVAMGGAVIFMPPPVYFLGGSPYKTKRAA